MRKRIKGLLLACAVVLGLGSAMSAHAAPAGKAKVAMHEITYKGQVYTVPVKTDKFVITGSVESMEDALVLNVKPQGALTVGGKFPTLFYKVTRGVTPIGEKTTPDLEAILKLKPDVILSSTKFPAATNAKLSKIATTIPVSHLSTDWMNNLKLLAALTGKQQEATQAILKYQAELKQVKAKIGPKFKGKTVMTIRVRSGNLFIYPQDVFFNPSIYADLGAPVPKEVKLAKAQQTISLEEFSAINPDYLFVQFAPEENRNAPKAMIDLQENPIWKSLKAVRSGNVYVNLVDPIAQGGTAYSKFAFVEALTKTKLYTGK